MVSRCGCGTWPHSTRRWRSGVPSAVRRSIPPRWRRFSARGRHATGGTRRARRAPRGRRRICSASCSPSSTRHQRRSSWRRSPRACAVTRSRRRRTIPGAIGTSAHGRRSWAASTRSAPPAAITTMGRARAPSWWRGCVTSSNHGRSRRGAATAASTSSMPSPPDSATSSTSTSWGSSTRTGRIDRRATSSTRPGCSRRSAGRRIGNGRSRARPPSPICWRSPARRRACTRSSWKATRSSAGRR